jgi:hypothetical protein
MTTSPLDTLSTFKQLKSIGFSESQAETRAHVIQRTEMGELVTRDDLRKQLNHLERRMTVKTSAMFIALGGLLAAVKYFG